MSSEKTTKVSLATPIDIAKRYILRHRTNMMFTRGQWHHYQNGTWLPLHDLAMDKEIWQLLEEFEGENRCRSATNIFNAVRSYLCSDMYVPEAEIDQFTNLINLQSGIYNLTDQELLPHSEQYYFTSQLPFEYNPNATCPWWDLYLQTTFVKPETYTADVELAEFVQEAIGYSLTTDVSHHVSFWCLGGGSNGKGVLFHVLERLTGTGFFPINVKFLSQNMYQLAELGNKRIAACSESNATDNLVDDAQIKALIAGDTMPARSPHQRPFILHPRVKLWWSMNGLPAAADTSEGFWRRIRVIPFNKEFEGKERIMDLKEHLDLELAGIFNWAMKGLRELRKRGHFATPQQVSDLTAKYRHEANPVSLFIEDNCKEEEDLIKCTSVGEVYADYKAWCLLNTYRPVASRKFRNEMIRLRHPARQRNPPLDKGQVFLGMRLKNEIRGFLP